MREATTRYVNTTSGQVGVTRVRRNGDVYGDVVPPNGEIELTEEEQQLTANAPATAEASPFNPQPYQDFDEAGEMIAEGVRAPLEVIADRPVPEATAEAPAPEGVRDPKEVVGA